MIAFATAGDESTSPIPVIPSSVWTRTTSVSCVPSQRSSISGKRSQIASTSVILTSPPLAYSPIA